MWRIIDLVNHAPQTIQQKKKWNKIKQNKTKKKPFKNAFIKILSGQGYIFLQMPCFLGRENSAKILLKTKILEEIQEGTIKMCAWSVEEIQQCDKIDREEIYISWKNIPLCQARSVFVTYAYLVI